MKTLSKTYRAFWPAMIGTLAAHQIAYVGHDDGHIHGYLETVGPALVVAGILGWIWTWARTSIDFRFVLVMQVTLFGLMEFAEHVAGAVAVESIVLGPLVAGLALIPLASAMSVLVDRFDEVFLGRSVAVFSLALSGRDRIEPDEVMQFESPSTWSIRAPPPLS